MNTPAHATASLAPASPTPASPTPGDKIPPMSFSTRTLSVLQPRKAQRGAAPDAPPLPLVEPKYPTRLRDARDDEAFLRRVAYLYGMPPPPPHVMKGINQLLGVKPVRPIPIRNTPGSPPSPSSSPEDHSSIIYFRSSRIPKRSVYRDAPPRPTPPRGSSLGHRERSAAPHHFARTSEAEKSAPRTDSAPLLPEPDFRASRLAPPKVPVRQDVWLCTKPPKTTNEEDAAPRPPVRRTSTLVVVSGVGNEMECISSHSLPRGQRH